MFVGPEWWSAGETKLIQLESELQLLGSTDIICMKRTNVMCLWFAEMYMATCSSGDWAVMLALAQRPKVSKCLALTCKMSLKLTCTDQGETQSDHKEMQRSCKETENNHKET